jgi:hypothetical protein
LRSEEILFIEDMDADPASARELGWDAAVLFRSARRLEQEFIDRGKL